MRPGLIMRTAAAVLAIAIVGATVTDQADARDRERSGRFETNKGRSGEFETTVSGNRRDGRSRQQTITTERGKTLERSSTTTLDKDSHSFSRETTGAGGQTRTVTGMRSGDGQRSGTYSTSSGKSGTYNSQSSRGDDGSVSTSRTWTNEAGESRTSSATRTFDSETKTLERTVTGPDGQSRSGSVTLSPMSGQQ